MGHESEEGLHFLQVLIDAIPMAIYYKDIQGIYGGCNKTFETMFGLSDEGIIGKTVSDIWPKELADIYHKMDQELFSHPGIQVFDSRVRFADGLNRDVSFHKATYEDMDGRLKGLVGVIVDISGRKQAEEKLRQTASELQAVFQAIPDLFFRFSADGTYQKLSAGHPADLYDPEGGLMGKQIDISKKLDRQFLEAIVQSLETQSLVVIEYPMPLDGETRFFEARFIPLLKDQVVVAVRNITERKQAEERLKYLGFHDVMTGLYNRSFFEEELKRLNAKRQLPLSIIIGDIDGLKLVNDTFGHRKGDQLIVKVAGIVKNACRAEDIVCRWGGDEFAILLPKTDTETTEQICDRIRKTCEKAKGDPIPVSVSLGGATKRDADQNIDDVLREAEDMMYWKKLGSNHTRFSVVTYLQRSLAEKTRETVEHGQRVQGLVLKMANALKLSKTEREELSILAVLHDIGEIAIPERILLKPCCLTSEEWQIVKEHPGIGNRIAMSAPNLTVIAEAILTHHERWDGTGYPSGLQGTRIPLPSRVLSVVDAYDAMISGRPYKEAISHREALEELERCAGTQFEPALVDLFVRIVSYD
jgi:diguanylate cyclase (GGDEF)-like protein/PAS domain S-box-containing protein